VKRCHLIITLFGIVMAAFVALAGRCLYLQSFRHAYYAEKSLKQQRSRLFQNACRGPILDTRGRVLAASNGVRTIFVEPRLLTEPKDTASRLSEAVHGSGPEICRLILEGKNPGFVRIKSGAALTECLAARKIRGVNFQTDWVRYYPMGALTSHAVGFTSSDGLGLGGIELAFHKALSGSSREELFLADVGRRPLRFLSGSIPADDREEDLSGSGVILTLDATIQEFARDELMAQYKDLQAESAIAVVADPKTGAILAMVSLPDFDPAESRTADPNTLCNHAVIDQFEPGSVLKPVLAAIALDAGVINTSEKIDCENGVYKGKGFGVITEYNNHPYGLMTVREILALSSNVGMAKIGQRMGAALQYSGLRLFGFSKTTGLGLPGEGEGTLWPPSRWTGYSVTRVPYGQEISVTAVQLVKAFCILANHGRLVRPHLVKAVVDASGQPDIRAYSLTLAGQVGYVVRPEVADWVVNTAMVAVINDEKGTGKSAKLEKWQVFGKTGTAQVARADGRGYEERAHIASFVGGAPVEDPTILVFVSIRRPNERLNKGYSGGMVAAPVVGRILDRTLTYLESRGYVFPRHDSTRLVKAR
jgi:cell division protein FtsI/penicillin-binding protein 2